MKNEQREDTEYQDTARENVVVGRNPVIELLRSQQPVDSVLLVRSEEHKGPLAHIAALAKEAGVPVKEVSPKKLDSLCGGAVHQGVVAFPAAVAYASVQDLFRRAEEKQEPPFFVLCDELQDPHNLGAVIRTAEAAGAHGVIVPKRRTAPLSGIVSKASAGALTYLPVARVSNMAAVIDELKARGVWIYGADMSGTDYRKADFSGPCALVVGSEGKGIGRLIREKCDVLVSLPMHGKINSLNASVAAGILLYTVAAAREMQKL